MAEYLPRYHDGNGESTPRLAKEDIAGGTLVMLNSDGTISAATAATPAWDGVAANDVKAGKYITVYKGGVQRPMASGALAVGDLVVAAAGGKVVKSTTPAVGTLVGVVELAAADGARADVRFER